jgi:hypothetical protein
VVTRTDTIRHLYENFDLKDKLCFTSFYNKLEKNVKKPRRLTDICEYCLVGKSLEKKIKKSTNTLKLTWIENSNSSSFELRKKLMKRL